MDKYKDEPTAEIPDDLVKLEREAAQAEAAWKKIKEGYRERIRLAMGEASAATINGVKVYTNRLQDKWREKQLREEHPSLTQHYVHRVESEVFDVELFAKAHPDVAAPYQVRSLREVS